MTVASGLGYGIGLLSNHFKEERISAAIKALDEGGAGFTCVPNHAAGVTTVWVDGQQIEAVPAHCFKIAKDESSQIVTITPTSSTPTSIPLLTDSALAPSEA